MNVPIYFYHFLFYNKFKFWVHDIKVLNEKEKLDKKRFITKKISKIVNCFFFLVLVKSPKTIFGKQIHDKTVVVPKYLSLYSYTSFYFSYYYYLIELHTLVCNLQMHVHVVHLLSSIITE